MHSSLSTWHPVRRRDLDGSTGDGDVFRPIRKAMGSLFRQLVIPAPRVECDIIDYVRNYFPGIVADEGCAVERMLALSMRKRYVLL